jgi:hypothetical protein
VAGTGVSSGMARRVCVAGVAVGNMLIAQREIFGRGEGDVIGAQKRLEVRDSALEVEDVTICARSERSASRCMANKIVIASCVCLRR